MGLSDQLHASVTLSHGKIYPSSTGHDLRLDVAHREISLPLTEMEH